MTIVFYIFSQKCISSKAFQRIFQNGTYIWNCNKFKLCKIWPIISMKSLYLDQNKIKYYIYDAQPIKQKRKKLFWNIEKIIYIFGYSFSNFRPFCWTLGLFTLRNLVTLAVIVIVELFHKEIFCQKKYSWRIGIAQKSFKLALTSNKEWLCQTSDSLHRILKAQACVSAHEQT